MEGSPGPELEVKPTYMSPEQERMRYAFYDLDYVRLMDEIDRAERDHALEYERSRIHQDIDWEENATLLVAMTKPEVILAVLDGTLPQRTVEGGDLHNWYTEAHEELEEFEAEDHDPIIYLNWLADEDGCGLSVSDFRTFLDRLEMAVRVQPDTMGIRDRVEDECVERTGNKYGSAASYHLPHASSLSISTSPSLRSLLDGSQC